MAKSNYLPRILFITGICLCGYTGSDNLVDSCLLPVVSEILVQKEVDLRYHDEVILVAKSALNTTDNRQPITDLRFHQPDSYQVTTKKIYDSQIGIREQGFNAGRLIEEYLRYVNLKKGQPWCAAFICWVYGKAGIDNPRSGWSPDLFKPNRIIWERAKSGILYKPVIPNYENNNKPLLLKLHSIHPARQQAIDNWEPTIGDVFGIYFPVQNRIAHAGFIDQWDGTWLITVEGNTNVSGSREGDGVYRKRRPVKSIYQVARYIHQP